MREKIEVIIGMPFMFFGWILSVIYIGFMIGWESGRLGEYKKKSLTHLNSVIDDLLQKNENLKKGE